MTRIPLYTLLAVTLPLLSACHNSSSDPSPVTTPKDSQAYSVTLISHPDGPPTYGLYWRLNEPHSLPKASRIYMADEPLTADKRVSQLS